jgi:hypothetical protein
VASRWLPADRLALVERLEALSGAVSESFFDAHGLGVAYRAAGEENSKLAKINSALHAAGLQGDVDEVLDAAAAFLDGGRAGAGLRPSHPEAGQAAPSMARAQSTDARGAQGVVVGAGNVQNNFYGVPPQAGVGRSHVDWLDELNAAADAVLGVEALKAGQPVDGLPQWTEATAEARRAEILKASEDLVRCVISAVRSGDPQASRVWMDLLPTLAPNPRRGGSTALLNLFRAPGVVVFHSAGLASCAMREDEVTGRLLTSRVELEDPRLGVVPAVVTLSADLVYSRGWASKQLHDYLVPLLAESVGARRADDAWQRWTYLVSVATTFLDAITPDASLHEPRPYLQASGPHAGQLQVVAGQVIRRQVNESGDACPLLAAGLCAGRAALFEQAAQTFESRYGAWAERMDWRALPGGGGVLPSGPHYPGERTS